MGYVLALLCIACIGLGIWLIAKRDEEMELEERKNNIVKGITLIILGILGFVMSVFLIERLNEDVLNFATYNQETINYFITDTLKIK